jgi:hypothetical protein
MEKNEISVLRAPTPDKGLLPPQYGMTHDYEGYQCDKYYTPPASETQDGEEEEESTLFGN